MLIVFLLITCISCENSSSNSNNKVINESITNNKNLLDTTANQTDTTSTSKKLISKNKIKTDNFNISDKLIKKTIKKDFNKIDFLDGICFTNNTKSELLIIELGTDYFRNKIVLVYKNNLPDKLLKLIPLYSKKENTSIPSNTKEKKLFLDNFIPKNILNIDHFESAKKIKLGINKDYAIKTYGKPDIIEQENKYEILKWRFIGDIVEKINKTIPKTNKPLALNSFGYEVTMFFKNNKLIGMILINEMP